MAKNLVFEKDIPMADEMDIMMAAR